MMQNNKGKRQTFWIVKSETREKYYYFDLNHGTCT